MNQDQVPNQVLNYFKYNLINILDEFEFYYTNNYKNMPLYIRSLYLYFSNLAENSIIILKKNNYDPTVAEELNTIPNIYKRELSHEDIKKWLFNKKISNDQFLGLCLFPIYFYDRFLHYIKYDMEKSLNLLYINIPIIESNLTKIQQALYRTRN
ncbi:hypothetical protein [Haloplasma contractile]|uniref:Uncharacterized protein n=1 Tax=Haloplasma contractile SSD-17B TaxID=1033810 RepID=U2EFB7_9MOLU|nr:hypothetical protein [Haloplasma contractile]ERJ13371.1 hypothetical protein HLPCO_000022 [Haloplasma contractile SSD-17B]